MGYIADELHRRAVGVVIYPEGRGFLGSYESNCLRLFSAPQARLATVLARRHEAMVAALSPTGPPPVCSEGIHRKPEAGEENGTTAECRLSNERVQAMGSPPAAGQRDCECASCP